MADFRAVTAVCEAVVRLLRLKYRVEDLTDGMQFQTYLSSDFSKGMTAGVSLFVYRVTLNGSHRSSRGRPAGGNARYRSPLPVDIHFLLTAWGKDASLQHRILGWMMRTMEDMPVLPAGLLNADAHDVFRSEESVEISLTEMSNEEMFRLWEIMVQHSYQLSIPYVARMVMIESTETIDEGALVQERTFEFREHDGESPA